MTHHQPGELEAMPRAKRLEFAMEQMSELQQRLHSAEAKARKICRVLHLEGAAQYDDDISRSRSKKEAKCQKQSQQPLEVEAQEHGEGEEEELKEDEEDPPIEPPVEPLEPQEAGYVEEPTLEPACKKAKSEQSEAPEEDDGNVDARDMETVLAHEESWDMRTSEFQRVYGWRPCTPALPP